ncbi:MAG: DUF262 domain-containing HNH endonuclease family protein [Defluviitaleaceae bacterium]|nr:DUF262 domain-containing HNH endonuclease family protein [Defluviitaleaceae bacterium]
MPKNIDANLKNIKGVFSNSLDSVLGKKGVYIIPDYQRAYNWQSNHQCDKLWQDMETFIESKNDSYFFGSIIINNNNDELYVIDGQQRATTFMLLLKAMLIRINSILKDFAADTDSSNLQSGLKTRRRDIINCLYMIDADEVDVDAMDIKYSGLDIKYENKSINEAYKNEVKTILHGNSYDDIESKVEKNTRRQKDNKYTNFFRNFKFFMEELNKFDSTKVNKWARSLLEECQVIVVISYQTEEAIEIFNSLNSTGMPLADADILSAKLYSNYGDDKTGFKTSWSEIIKNTNNLSAKNIASIDDILNQYMYILRAQNQEKETSIPSIRRYFTETADYLKNPQKFISDIEKIIDIWLDDNISKEARILYRLNRNFKLFYSTYLFIKDDETDENKNKFTEALLKIFLLLSIVEIGYSSSKFKVFLLTLNLDIGVGSSTDELVQKIKSHIAKEFKRDVVYDLLVNTNPESGIVYINEYLFAKETRAAVDFDISKIEVEHIMPSSGKNISAIQTDAGMDADEFGQYVNKLGNKILLEKQINGYISNDWFKVKKLKYKDSIFPIARVLSAYTNDKWQKDDIDNATKKAAMRIVDYIFA